MFKNKYLKIIDGVANGTSTGSGITDIFMCNFESKYHQDFSNDFKLSLKDLRSVCGLNILIFYFYFLERLLSSLSNIFRENGKFTINVY